MLHLVVAAALFVVDQLTKLLTVAKVELNTGIVELPGFLHVTYVKNFGAAFGILQGAGWLRIVLAALLVVFTGFMVLCFAKGWFRTGLARWSGAVFLAGIFANGVDRAIFGFVVDLLEFDSGKFAIFNLADCLALVGGIVFCISLLAGGFSTASDDEEDEEDEPVRRAPATERRPVRSAEGAQRPVRPAAPANGDRPAQRPARPAAPANGERPVRSAPANGSAPAQRPARPTAPANGERPARPAAPTNTDRPARAAVSANTDRPARPAAPATGSAPVQRPARPTAPAAAERPARAAAPANTDRPARPAAPAPRPAAPAAKPAAPKPAPKPTPAEDEFDLDAIMAEFK